MPDPKKHAISVPKIVIASFEEFDIEATMDLLANTGIGEPFNVYVQDEAEGPYELQSYIRIGPGMMDIIPASSSFSLTDAAMATAMSTNCAEFVRDTLETAMGEVTPDVEYQAALNAFIAADAWGFDDLAIAFNAAHTLLALGFTVISSREEKEDIKLLPDGATDVINKMKVSSFKYKKDPIGPYHFGLIIDEAPEEVIGTDGKSVMLENMVGLLLKSNQELAARLARVENELEFLKGDGK
jgi:hypothetical protein